MTHSFRPSGARPGRLIRAVTVAACAVGLASASVLAPAVAHAADPTAAGELAIHGCSLPDGTPVALKGWAARLWGVTPGSNTGAVIDNCAQGGTFAATTNSTSDSPPIPKGMSVGWMFEAPSGLKIKGLTLKRDTYLGQLGTAPDAARYSAGVANGMPAIPWTGVEAMDSLPLLEHPIFVHPGGTHYALDATVTDRSWDRAAFWISCNPQSASGSCPSANFGSGTFVSRSTVYLLDDSAPTVTSVSGSMTQATPLKGSESITVNASDGTGSGVYKVALDIDGREFPLQVDGNGGRCRDAQTGNDDPHEFVDPRPCLPDVVSTLALDTTTLTDGPHTLKVVVEDASGRRTVGYGGQDIVVDNVPPPISTSRPVVTGDARPGVTLTTDRGAWTGENIVYGYQWQREFHAGWEDIPGATRASYTLTDLDVGRRVRSHLVAGNAQGQTDAYSVATATVTGSHVVEKPKDPASVAPGAERSIPGTVVVETRVLNPNGAGASADARLTAAFAKTTDRTMTVRYGRPIPVTGRLLNQAGHPIVGAKLDVHSVVRTVGGTYQPQGSVVSNADGEFRYLAPSGPSRTVRFAYRHHLQDAEYSQTSTVQINVVPAITLSASRTSLRNGQAVRFAGRVSGAPTSSRKLVEIQALDGVKWRTIASTRLRAGRFAYGYRFTRTRGTVTYAFRARVRTEAGWPFATGQSRVARVKVRG